MRGVRRKKVLPKACAHAVRACQKETNINGEKKLVKLQDAMPGV